MVTRRDWYARVNDTWHDTPPALTAPEAIRAARKLHRFVLGRTWQGEIKVTSGRRYTWARRGVLYVNPSRGWHALIHDLSHWLHRRRPGLKPADYTPHSKAHARLELRMRREALKRGWLAGALLDKVPAVASHTRQETPPIVKAPKARPDLRARRYALTLDAIGRWETKAKRARNALRKLAVRRRYYERTLPLPHAEQAQSRVRE